MKKVYPNNEIWITFILDTMEAVWRFVRLITGLQEIEILQFTQHHWIVIVQPGGALGLMEDLE